MDRYLKTIKGDYSITTHEEYVILYGDALHILKNDGTLVSSRTDLACILKVCFVADNRILIDCMDPNAYILVSLCDGATCAIFKRSRVGRTANKFTLSHNGDVVYDYFEYRLRYTVFRITISDQKIDACVLKNKLRAVNDILCDEEDRPCVLVSHYQEHSADHLFEEANYQTSNNLMCFPDPAYVVDTPDDISLNGIHYVGDFKRKRKNDNNWIATWEFDFPRISKYLFGDIYNILTQDLHVYNWKNKTCYFLAENDPDWVYPDRHFMNYYMDSERNLIVVKYNYVNVVIDITTRKMVARYNNEFAMGCLIGDAFWVCSKENGIERKPFPHVEDISKQNKNRLHVFRVTP